MRRTKSARGLDTSLSQEAIQPRRGPISELTDPQIQGRAVQLLSVFEWDWGRIGLALERCKTPDDLIEIFSPLVETHVGSLISPLCRPSTAIASGAQLRKIRSKLRGVQKLRNSIDLERSGTHDAWQRADNVFATMPIRNRRVLRRETKERRKAFARATQKYRSITANEYALESELRALEGPFARKELFNFLKKQRCELNPVNLACAVAGLPFMGWRQSRKRCDLKAIQSARGPADQLFKAIRYLVNTAKERTERVLSDHFRNSITTLPSRYANAKKTMADNWLFLERAIRAACQAEPHPRAIPFNIMDRYVTFTRSQTEIDRMIARQKKINLGRNKLSL